MAGVRGIEWLIPHAAQVADLDWEAIYREEMPRIYNFFRYRVGNPATAEDLTSLAFEKAWRARQRYRRERAAVSTWILAIARNVAIDYFRRTRVELPIDDTHAAGDETPETAAVRRSDLRRLGTLLGGLPPRERELLALKFGAGATNRAIAKLTGLSESNVGTILHRTIAGLRATWDAGGR